MMLRTIQAAEPLSERRVRLVWGDGSESVVDLGPVLAKGGVFEFLEDPAAFVAVAVGERGRTLVWRDPDGDEIDLCADALWRSRSGCATGRPLTRSWPTTRSCAARTSRRWHCTRGRTR